MRDNGNSGARRDPLLIGLEFDAKPVVQDTQIAVFITHNGLRHGCLHFLCDHADVSAIIANVTEAIESETIGEMAEEDDVVL